MLGSLVATTHGPAPLPDFVPRPVVEAAPLEAPTPLAVQRMVALMAATPAATPEPAPQVLIVSAPMRLVSPQPIPITVGELYQSLARSDWPAYLWDDLEAIARCESTLNLNAEGDGGRAIGLLQIRVDAHREKSVRYDLRALDDQLAAAWLVYVEASGFRPWSCA